MALWVGIDIKVNAPDGSPQVSASAANMTVNPMPNNWEHEAAVARVQLDLLIDQLKVQMNTNLDDWVAAMNLAKAAMEDK